MAPYQGLIDTIFEEIEGRQPGELTSLPQRRGDWYYQSRYSEGSQYREWLRWPASDPDAREGPTENVQVVLDEPMLAADLEYFRLGSQSVSNDGYVNRCVNDIRRRPSQPLIQWRFHPHTVHRGRVLCLPINTKRYGSHGQSIWMQLRLNRWQQPAELQTSHLWWIEKQVCRLPYGFKPSQVGYRPPAPETLLPPT